MEAAVGMTEEGSNRAEPGEEVRSTEQELCRLNLILQTLYQCNHALVHATNENELFRSICQILVEVGGLRLAWVGRCENDTAKTVIPVAKAGFGDDYVENAKISWSEETVRGRGPTGVALRTGNPYWVKDTRIDPCFAPWRSAAISRGYASCVTLPLIADGKRLGNLSLYAGEPNVFNEGTIKQYTELADNLAYGVSALRTREERREQSARLARSNELLRRSLDALARDQRLQSFVDQVLIVLTEQLGGHSSTLWLIDVQVRKGYLHSVFEDGRVVSGAESDHPNARKPREWASDNPSWIALQMKRPFFLADPIHDPELEYTPAQQARL
jgi:transcriptional regulator with GAF, ATPase, and Fis domain